MADRSQQDREIYSNVSSPTAGLSSVLMCLTFAAEHGMEIAAIDIGGAYLNADRTWETLYVELDPQLTPMWVDGHSDWKKHVDEILAISCDVVDEILAIAHNKEDIRWLHDKLVEMYDGEVKINQDKDVSYLGMHIKSTNAGVHLSMEAYARKVWEDYGHPGKEVNTPALGNLFESEDCELLSKSKSKE